MVSTRTTRVVAGAALAVAAVAWSAPATTAATHDVVVSEVYGGGGNKGATWTNDYVELYNAGTSTVRLDGWSVQYASAAGTSYQVTPLSGSIAPGRHYLVGEAAGSGGTALLPATDEDGSIAMSATAGKVALVRGTHELGCGASCHAAEQVEDFVGYAADDYEGSGPAPRLSALTSDARAADGRDTDDNGTDFVAGSPSPTNAAGETSGRSGRVTGLQVHDVQGAGHLSPYAGATAVDVPGVATAASGSGFWMQSTEPDDDPATSEGIYVFTGSRPTVPVAAGDAVTVSGKVSEYRAGSAGLTVTELTGPSVTVVSSGNELPAATLVGPEGRVPPSAVIEDDAEGNVERQRSFDPEQDGIDFWESMEGMRVAIDRAQVVGPTNRYHETPVVPLGSGPRTGRGGILATADDYNPERVVLGDELADLPSANTGDTLAGTTVGVLDYAYGNFMLEPTATPTVVPGGLAREVTRDDHGSELSIASFNVENLDPGDPSAKFDGLAAQIVHNLASPDIVGLEEVQDDSGPADDGTVSAGETLRLLTDAITRAGGPSYRWAEIDPVNDAEGGQPGGNIRVAFLYRPGASLQLVRRGEPSSTEGTDVAGTGGDVHLTRSPGRLDPANRAWTDSRVPLAAEFAWRGAPLFVIGNHFASKGGDDPLMGRRQPPQRPSEVQRHEQARVVRGFVDELLAADPSARVAVLGDLNDFEYSRTADILVGSGATALTDLPRTLPAPERYTYVYEGNSQVLDHILLSPGLVAQRYAYDVVHVNAEFADQLSDHDPQVVRLGPSTVRR